jgi:pyruvoyl-dependent arginine decarboxylase (PvlArgDC)
MKNHTLFGNRVPHEYFITKGKGQSSCGSKGLPYETGSYDAALSDAGIEDANIIEYTSVMPPTSIEISREKWNKKNAVGRSYGMYQSTSKWK